MCNPPVYIFSEDYAIIVDGIAKTASSCNHYPHGAYIPRYTLLYHYVYIVVFNSLTTCCSGLSGAGVAVCR